MQLHALVHFMLISLASAGLVQRGMQDKARHELNSREADCPGKCLSDVKAASDRCGENVSGATIDPILTLLFVTSTLLTWNGCLGGVPTKCRSRLYKVHARLPQRLLVVKEMDGENRFVGTAPLRYVHSATTICFDRLRGIAVGLT